MRQGILVLVAIAASLVGGVPSRARACAIAPVLGEVVRMGGEQALIVWDERQRLQHFIRRADFETASDDFGFLVPTPGQPELAEADDGVFERLASATAPEIVHAIRWEPVTCCTSLYFFTMRSAGGEVLAIPGVRGVTVLAETRVAGLDAAVLAADDPEALRRWLGEHGYDAREALTPWLDPYVRRGWTITAFKIARGQGAGAGSVGTRAVRMSFRTDRPFYPYREPADASPSGPRELRVFFVGSSRFAGTFEDGNAWGAETRWARPLADPRIFDRVLPDGVGLEGAWLTEFVDRHSARAPAGDLQFAPARSRAEVVPDPIVVEDPTPLPLPLELIVLGVILWLVVRHRRKRRAAATAAATGAAAAVLWLGLATSAQAQPIQEQAPPPEPATPPPPAHGCVGRWQGAASDYDTAGAVTSTYRVTVELRSTSGRNCGDIHYTLGCWGPLHCTGGDATHVRADEEYTANPPGACAPPGRLEAECNGDTMEWRWFETTERTGMTSRARLQRSTTPLPREVTRGSVPAHAPPTTGCGACTTAPPPPAPAGGVLVIAGLALIGARQRARFSSRRSRRS